MTVMKVELAGDIVIVEHLGRDWQAQAIRLGDIREFIFNGKCPPRRKLRVLAKKFM